MKEAQEAHTNTVIGWLVQNLDNFSGVINRKKEKQELAKDDPRIEQALQTLENSRKQLEELINRP